MYWHYNAEVIRVVDSSVLELRVDLGFRVVYAVRVRLENFNAPPTTGATRPEGMRVQQIIERHLHMGRAVVVRTYKGGSRDEWRATVFVDGVDLVDLIQDAVYPP